MSYYSRFQEFSNDGKMVPDQLAQFTQSCTGGSCHKDDTRILSTFSNYDTSQKGFLDCEDFIALYESSCRSVDKQ